MFGTDIGIDLGTVSIIVYAKGKEGLINEPSVVAVDCNTNEIISIGEEARKMIGKTPGNIKAIRPLRKGVIADYDTTEKMMRYFIAKAGGKGWFFKPRVVICIPSGATDVEERAVKEATLSAGAREAYILEEPVAAALGAGIDISQAEGNLVVDIGGGTTDIAVLSLGGVVNSLSLRVGGDDFDEAIVRFIRREYNMMIGERTAEDVKIKIGSAYPERKDGESTMAIRGRDLLTGLPKSLEVTTATIYRALLEPVEAIIAAVKEVLECTPPELAADIIDKGVVMTGGGSLLDGFSDIITERTNLPAIVAENAVLCVALGTGKALENLDLLKATGTFSTRKRH
ncbi:MAG: rod shape-determining protein MreB [Clostridia bacterium]